MRAMNGRLQIIRSPLMRNTFGRHNEQKRQHHHHRQRLDSDQLPKMVQFDESSDSYRCFCSCFHVKTGAFCIAASGIALTTILLMIVGITRNTAAFLVPHLFVQGLSILCFLGLIIIGIIAFITDSNVFYRLLNAAPFSEFPGQITVALPVHAQIRIYVIFFMYIISFFLEAWFIVIIYNCNRYFTERKKYMSYCLAYSTPLKTLNSAR
uniref:Uncharacterized protein n=1 Tax=Panagrolaimus davidi TaxID=227884 RepID=A0A914PVU3_9BILA